MNPDTLTDSMKKFEHEGWNGQLSPSKSEIKNEYVFFKNESIETPNPELPLSFFNSSDCGIS